MRNSRGALLLRIEVIVVTFCMLLQLALAIRALA